MTESRECDIPTLVKAAEDVAGETETLLEPDKPLLLGDDGQTTGAAGHATNGSAVPQPDPSSTSASAQVEKHPGADLQLQDLIRDSPFLDFDSPMTPYEWFKFVVMVISARVLHLCSEYACRHVCWSVCILGFSHPRTICCSDI